MEINQIDKILNEQKETERYLASLINPKVAKYTSQYKKIKEIQIANTTNENLNNIALQLTQYLYSLYEGIEGAKLSLDIASENYKMAYNHAFALAEGTNLAKQKTAELDTIQLKMVVITWERVVGLLTSYEEATTEMINTVKKVLTVRLAELELSRGKQI